MFWPIFLSVCLAVGIAFVITKYQTCITSNRCYKYPPMHSFKQLSNKFFLKYDDGKLIATKSTA